MMSNTIFFFTSDNGGLIGAGGSNLPFRGQKATLWQGGLRVPAFIAGPLVPSGATYGNMMHITDVQMTLLDMIGVKHNGTKPLDGVSHWEAIRGPSTISKRSRSYSQVQSRLNREPAAKQPRSEILLNIDREYDRGYSPDPLNFTLYPNSYFNTR